MVDLTEKKEYTYTYREERIVRSSESDIETDGQEGIIQRTLLQAVMYTYDGDGKLTKKRILPENGTGRVIYYENRENENAVVKYSAGGRTIVSHSKTDSFGRKEFDELQLGTGFVSRQFSYHAGAESAVHKTSGKLKSSPTTNLVSQIVLSDGRTISYEYDAEERITKVTDSVEGTSEYTYDAQGQLLTETKDGAAVNTMTYDSYGNILTKNGKAYTYDSTWKDLLISYDGQSITYDAQGNPTSYLGHTLTWEKGRQLKSYDGHRYTYNGNGIRTSKTVDGVTHTYTLGGTKIQQEAWGSHTLIPLYDNEESVCGLLYDNVPYYFFKNLQGDVIAITDQDGKTVAQYEYDAWGVCTVTQDTTTVGIAAINPFRYRGYYFDQETGLYYLQSRYYNPVVGRFVNADIPETIFGQNCIVGIDLFTYCENDCITRDDFTGYNSGTLARRAGAATTFLAFLLVVIKACGAAGASNAWNPVGWVLLAVAGIALLVFGVWSLANYLSDKSLKADLSLMNYASTAATPPPPNKGGRGTRVSSKTLYNKRGNRIDVENPGNRQGQIHLQQGKTKYYYNVKDQAFHIGSSGGKLAPKSIQKLLTDKEVIKAIAKGLRILGY